MKIWRLYHDQDKYAQIAPISSFDEDVANPLHDARKSWTSNWKTPDVKEVRFKGTKWVDVNSYLIMPLCNTKTKKALICLIEDSVEWLPVTVQRKNKKMEINEHFILHITNIVDALDYEIPLLGIRLTIINPLYGLISSHSLKRRFPGNTFSSCLKCPKIMCLFQINFETS